VRGVVRTGDSRDRGLDAGEHFVNVDLTVEEHKALKALAAATHNDIRYTGYPAVLQYLEECAPTPDLPIVMDEEALSADRYWGTERQVREARELMRGRAY